MAESVAGWPDVGVPPGFDGAAPGGEVVMSAPHDVPTAGELVEAVREFLERDVVPAMSGRARFHGQVAVRVLAMVERELALGADQERAHAERLAALGVGSEAELVAAIRSGALDDRYDEVKAAVIATVEDKLRVANPAYLDRRRP